MADNWFSQAFANPNFKRALSEMGQDLGYGLTQGTNIGNAFGIAAQRGQDLTPYRDQQQAARLESDKIASQYVKTTDWLNSQGYTDLVPLVEAGQGGAALSEAFKRMQPGYGQSAPVSPIEINGQLVNPLDGSILGDYRDPNAGQPAPPSGYQYSAPGQLAPIPGGPQDPASAPRKPPTEAELRAAGLTTVVNGDAALLLGTPEQPGIYEQLANGGDQAWNMGGFGINPLSAMSSPEYRQAKDAVASIAQSYLYSTSGASAPEGEAERIANSVTPKPFDSPEQLADKKRRLEAMVLSIQQKQGNAAPGTEATGGWEVIGVTQ